MINIARYDRPQVTEYKKVLKLQYGVEISHFASLCIIQAGVRLPLSLTFPSVGALRCITAHIVFDGV